MSVDVFISYAHATAQAAARQLRDELFKSGLKVFLDERQIPYGSAFPRDIATALLESRLAVVFADETYFLRPFCVYEFQVIVAPYRAAGDADDSLLDHVAVVLPSSGDVASVVAHLPPPLARVSWPSADHTSEIAGMIRNRLQKTTLTLDSRLAEVNDDALARLRAGGDIPLAWAPAPDVVDGNARQPNSGRPSFVDLAVETRGETFIGRAAELWQVFHQMVTCRAFNSSRSCEVQGLGGSGKSQLAAEFLARYGGKFFPGGAIWISAEGDTQTLVSQFRSVLRAVSPNDSDPTAGETDPERQRDILGNALAEHFASSPPDNKVLWVVDGVPEPSEKRSRRISYWCPPVGNVSLLVTSRSTGLEKMDAHITLGGLSERDAVEFLTRPSVDRLWLKEDEWSDIASWVGGLPLAMVILRAGLSDGYTTAEALKLARKKEPSALLDSEMDVLRGEVEDERLRGITEAFDFSYRALDQHANLRNAAHLVAQLAPYPLAEKLLAELIEQASIGRLAKRSWIQAGAGRAVRRWTMHRIPASFLRSRLADPQQAFADLFKWLQRMTTSNLDDDDLHALGYHLMVIQRSLLARMPDAGDSLSSALQAAREFAVAATGLLDRPEARGLQYLAAGLGNNLGAGDDVAASLERAYGTADLDTAAAIPHTLQALDGNARASALMKHLLEDTRDMVRLQALVNAPGLKSLDLAIPLLEAILKEPSDAGTAGYDIYLDNRCPALPEIVSDLARALSQGSPQERQRAAELLGRALLVNGKELKARGFASRSIIGALLRVALDDPSESVAQAAVASASTYFDDEAYQNLSAELLQAIDSERRAHVLSTLGAYLSGTRRPPPPKVHAMEFRDSGGLKMSFDMGGRVEPLPPGVYQPLIDAAARNDPLCGAVAARAILDTNDGQIAVGLAANQMLDARDFVRVAALGDVLASESPNFINAHWWRGQAREALGDKTGALADFSTVIEQSPGFAYAFLRRGNLLFEGQDFANALPDLQRATDIDPEYAFAQHLKTICLHNLGRYPEAEVAADRLIALSPEVGQAWFLRGIARYNTGRATEALQDVRRAVELDPSDTSAGEFKSQLEGSLGKSGSQSG
jgi:tetratricopeptide (TPR) repeat protein